jgi:hypothetical protein
MVSHSKFKSLFWSSVSEVVYSDKEKGIELRACWPEELPPLGNCAPVAEAADGLSRELDAAAAATFDLLEGVSEPWLEVVEPNMSMRVLWRFPLEVLLAVEGVTFVFASSPWSDEAATAEGFSSLVEVAVA